MHSRCLECSKIQNAFKEAETPLFIAYYRRTLPRFIKVKDWLEAGQIGEIRHVSWKLTKPPSELDLSRTVNWRTEVDVAPGGYFEDSKGIQQYCGNGKYADIAIFSFHPVKHIACGEGGMITTDSKELYDKLLILRTHGITKNPELLKN